MMPFILYVYLLLFIKLSLFKINAIKLLTSLLLKLWKVITLHKKEYMSLYNLATHNFKEPILLIRRPWPYVIHHLHFMNMYRLYIAWYRPILLINVGCINWYFRNKTLFLWLKRPYFHFTDTGVYYPL